MTWMMWRCAVRSLCAQPATDRPTIRAHLHPTGPNCGVPTPICARCRPVFSCPRPSVTAANRPAVDLGSRPTPQIAPSSTCPHRAAGQVRPVQSTQSHHQPRRTAPGLHRTRYGDAGSVHHPQGPAHNHGSTERSSR